MNRALVLPLDSGLGLVLVWGNVSRREQADLKIICAVELSLLDLEHHQDKNVPGLAHPLAGGR